jgi:hypothetical protein
MRRRFLLVRRIGLLRILFDQGVPRGLTASLRGHEVTEARKLKWERISNGAMLGLAEDAGFELLVTTDKERALSTEPCRAENLYRGSWKLTLVACAAAS